MVVVDVVDVVEVEVSDGHVMLDLAASHFVSIAGSVSSGARERAQQPFVYVVDVERRRGANGQSD